MAKLEEVRLVNNPDDHDAEDIERLRAANMMPRWGQILAWLVWELPWAVYGIVAVAPLVVWFRWTTAWKLTALGVALVGAFMLHARERVRNPFRTYVLVTRRPVPASERTS